MHRKGIYPRGGCA
uniref:Uncharacterized protein n=1 Tax=Vitis vinifera TaxID=29760 RepID=F6I7E1_VITVI